MATEKVVAETHNIQKETIEKVVAAETQNMQKATTTKKEAKSCKRNLAETKQSTAEYSCIYPQYNITILETTS